MAEVKDSVIDEELDSLVTKLHEICEAQHIPYLCLVEGKENNVLGIGGSINSVGLLLANSMVREVMVKKSLIVAAQVVLNDE